MTSPFTSTTPPTTWRVIHSNRSFWSQKRNLHAIFTHSGSLDFTYQDDSPDSEIKEHNVKAGEWKVLKKGRDGKLPESWMIETEWGIEDSSGEARADWRPRYQIVAFSSLDKPPMEVDVLHDGKGSLSIYTLGEIEMFLKKLDDLDGESVNLGLERVLHDGGRDEEMKRREEERKKDWENRTGAEAGISETLVYDDVRKGNKKRLGSEFRDLLNISK